MISLLSIFLLLCVNTQGVSALSEMDLNSIYKDTVWYQGSIGQDDSCSPSLIGDSNKEKIWNYFRSVRGLSAESTAGIMGNIQSESAGTWDPRVVQGNPPTYSDTVPRPVDGNSGYGLAQWTTVGRKENLIKFADSKNLSESDLTLQLDFIWYELENSYPSVLDVLKQPNTGDLETPTYKFLIEYEAPADIEGNKPVRLSYARDIFAEFGSGGVAPGNPACGGGIGTSPEGFVFPLKTTQAVIKQGVDGAVWCYSSSTNCHHDYNAADIHAETGTSVLAVHNGIIKNIRTGPARLVLIADNGRTYYYTHMRAGSITVREGQSVTAGQVIGAVGTNADTGNDSVRHLHIDELPSDQYNYRPGCGGSDCLAYPFINIQPELIASFKNLPG